MAAPKTKVSNVVITALTFLLLEVASLFCVRHTSLSCDLFFARIGHSISGFFFGAATSVTDYFSLRSQNERLAAENAALLSRYFADPQAVDPADPQTPPPAVPHTFLPAEIIGARTGSNHNYFILNRGSKDGLEVGDGVITACGVVGIVESVSRNVCFVTSMQSFRMNVSARIGHDGPVGPVFWKSGKVARMENIPLHYAETKGDTVYTSGYSAIFPADIPIGVIESSSTQNGLSASLDLTLFEDYSSLRYVMVVKSDYFKEIKNHEQ